MTIFVSSLDVAKTIADINFVASLFPLYFYWKSKKYLLYCIKAKLRLCRAAANNEHLILSYKHGI
jgi:hypothetical protein